mgnify:CR=1 FL=1
MIARVILGILLAYMLIAYFPLIIKKIQYVIAIALGLIAVFALRAAPALAEPLGYGLLIALVAYIVVIVLHNKGKLKDLWQQTKDNPHPLPMVKISAKPRLSMLLTLVLYTAGLTFVIYLLILIIYVN